MFYSSHNQNICNSYKNFLITVFYITTYITCFSSLIIILDSYSHSTAQIIYISVLVALTFIKPLCLYLYAFNDNYHFSCLRHLQHAQNINRIYLLFITICDIYFMVIIYSLTFFTETLSSDESLFFKVIIAFSIFADYLMFLLLR